jgi:hypothetical protein
MAAFVVKVRAENYVCIEGEKNFRSLQIKSQTFASLAMKYECSVKVFNSSVEILVEKPLAEI